MSDSWGYIPEEQLREYVTKDGEKLYALDNGGPVGDGFYSQPANRYMGIANRPANISCGSCTLVGMCQFCVQRWPTPVKK